MITVLTMMAGLVVARVAGPQVVGIISYGTSYVGIWLFITGLFGSGHIKLISEGQDIGHCMRAYSRLFWGSLCVYIIAVSGFYLVQKYLLHVGFESRSQEIVIVLSLFIAVFNKFYEYASTTFTATMEQAKANLPEFLKSIILQFGRIVVVLLGFKAIGLSAWNAFITFLFLPIVFKLLKKYPPTAWNRSLFNKYIAFSVPILLIVVINSIVQYSDKLLLAHYTSTTELGYYSAANSFGGLIMLASTSIGNIFFPLFSSLLARKDWGAVRQKIMQYQEMLALFVFPFVCALLIISRPMLTTVLGMKYGPSVEPFMIISLATYIMIVGMPYGNIITGSGRFYLHAGINLIKLVVFLLSITLFVSPRFLGLGAIGVALNLLVVNILCNYFWLFFARRLSGLTFYQGRNIARYVLASAIAIALYGIRDDLAYWFSLWWIVAVPVYLASVYGLMWIMGLVTKKQFEIFTEIFNLKKVVRYIQNELCENTGKNE